MSFSTVKVFGEKASASKVYYNATVVNNNVRTDQKDDDPSIVFADTRQTPIVPDVSKYQVSVENFVINGATKNLPVFIPQIAPVAQVSLTGYLSTGNGNTRYNFAFTTVNLVKAGDFVTSVSGLANDVYNFSTPKQVVSVTSTYIIVAYNTASTGGTITDGGVLICPNLYNINYTIYTVSFGAYDGAGGYSLITVPILWEPENKTPYTVIPKQVSPQLETDYYYCYNYTHWIKLVNYALFRAWVVKSANYGTNCPFFTFDSSSGLFTLCQDANTSINPYGELLVAPYSVTSTEAGYTQGEYSFVGMNSNLEGLLSNWTTTFYSAESTPWSEGAPLISLPEFVFEFGLNRYLTSTTNTGIVAQGILQNNTQFLVNPFTNENLATSYICVTQDFISTGTLWSPVSSIVITTTKVPIRNEFVSLPVAFGSKNIGTQNKAASAFQKVLIETPINAVTADIWRGFINYQPLTPTYSSMEDSKVALYELDFYVYWRNNLTGALIPLRLYNSGNFSIRLLFERV